MTGITMKTLKRLVFVAGVVAIAASQPAADERKKSAERSDKRRPSADRPRRLTYAEKLELEALPGRIESLESQERELHGAMSEPAFYQQDRQAIVEANALVGTTGPGKKVLSTVTGTLWGGFIVTAVLVIALKVVF